MAVVCDGRLRGCEFEVLKHLRRASKEFEIVAPSVGKIAKSIGYSKRAVQYAIPRLCARGLLLVKERSCALPLYGDIRHCPNVYVLVSAGRELFAKMGFVLRCERERWRRLRAEARRRRQGDLFESRGATFAPYRNINALSEVRAANCQPLTPYQAQVRAEIEARRVRDGIPIDGRGLGMMSAARL